MLLCPWDFPGKNAGVGCHFLLQRIFLTKGWNLHLLHCRQILYGWATREALLLQYIYFVVQSLSHAWLCDPMTCSTPVFLFLHYLSEFAQIQVHWVNDAIQPSHPLSPSFLALYPPIPHNRRTNTRNRVRKTGGQKSDIRDKEGDRQLFQRYRVSRRPRLVLGIALILPKFRH